MQQLNDEEECTAREVMQSMLEARMGSESIERPTRIEGTPPENPNVYSDGSVHNPKDHHWQVAG